MNELNEKRMKDYRGGTPKEVLQEAIDENDDISDVVIVTRDKDGLITTDWSCDDALKVIGALEVAKVSITQS